MSELPTIYNSDIVPRLIDMGIEPVLRSLSYRNLHQDEFMAQIGGLIPAANIPWDIVLQVISDMHAIGSLIDVQTDATLPAPIGRPEAPTGFGQNANGIWFSTPVQGSARLRWYRNGEIKLVEDRADLSVDRSISKSALGVYPGDTVQLAVESYGVVGWWGSISIE